MPYLVIQLPDEEKRRFCSDFFSEGESDQDVLVLIFRLTDATLTYCCVM